MFGGSIYMKHTIDSDTEATKTKKGALIELFKKQRPGEPPSVDAAYALLQQLFFDPKRYDLTRVGRYKLNARLGPRHRPRDAHADPRRHPSRSSRSS